MVRQRPPELRCETLADGIVRSARKADRAEPPVIVQVSRG